MHLSSMRAHHLLYVFLLLLHWLYIDSKMYRTDTQENYSRRVEDVNYKTSVAGKIKADKRINIEALMAEGCRGTAIGAKLVVVLGGG